MPRFNVGDFLCYHSRWAAEENQNNMDGPVEIITGMIVSYHEDIDEYESVWYYSYGVERFRHPERLVASWIKWGKRRMKEKT